MQSIDIENSKKHLEFLKKNNLTRLNVVFFALLALYYFVFILLVVLKTSFRINFATNELNEAFLSWSDTHKKNLKVLAKSKDITTLNNKMDYSYFNTSLSVSELFFCIREVGLRNILCSEGFVSFAELLIFERWLSNSRVRKVFVAGHYDRLVFNISLACKNSKVNFSVCQHGVVSFIELPKKIFVDEVYLKYGVSEVTFEKFYVVGKFFLTPELDFDRSRIINAERAKNNRTVLFIGQFGQVEKTLDILKYCSSFNDVDILFLQHPSDKASGYEKYAKVINEPILGPFLVISLFSSFAYSYHLLGYRTVFFPGDTQLDFLNDGTVTCLETPQGLCEYLKIQD
ncbi:hypothetical protein NOZ11_002869 [Vibrio parahaemolyticus]|nr:hypothetical protein [Vibrio parahaemolyticus]